MFRAREFNYSMRRKPEEMRWLSVNGYFENQSSTPFNLRPSKKIHQNTPRCSRREFLRRPQSWILILVKFPLSGQLVTFSNYLRTFPFFRAY